MGGISPPVEAELDFRLISLIHAPAICNLHFGEIFICCLQFDHFIFPMLIFLAAFPVNFTNMGTIHGGSLNCNFAILFTAIFIVILVHIPLAAPFLAPSGALIAIPTYYWSSTTPLFQITPVLNTGLSLS